MTLTRRRRVTGPDHHTRFLVTARASSCCEVCGISVVRDICSYHHRVPRGMGGTRSPWINLPSNILLVCGSATSMGGCHESIESHRERAYANGWLVRRGAFLPAEVPVLTYYAGRVLLDDHGAYVDLPEAV